MLYSVVRHLFLRWFMTPPQPQHTRYTRLTHRIASISALPLILLKEHENWIDTILVRSSKIGTIFPAERYVCTYSSPNNPYIRREERGWARPIHPQNRGNGASFSLPARRKPSICVTFNT